MLELSVIVPCYNGERVIGEALRSLESQKMVLDKRVEIIVIDDGSTDKTPDVLAKYATLPNFVSRRVTNAGAAKARNLGLELARGKWMAFLDADDLFLQDALDDSFFQRLECYDRQLVEIIRTPWVSLKTGWERDGTYTIMSARCLRAEDHHCYSGGFWSCLYRTAFIKEKEIRFLSYSRMDVENTFRYLCFANAEKLSLTIRCPFMSIVIT